MGTIKDFFEQKLFTESKKNQDKEIAQLTVDNKEEQLTSIDEEKYCTHVPRAESEKIKQWRQKQIKLLADKDKNEEKQKQEWLKSAKKELEAWHKQNADLISKLKKKNRELVKTETPSAEENRPLRWEHVCGYCDISSVAMETSSSKDKSRMLAVLLRLKTPTP